MISQEYFLLRQFGLVDVLANELRRSVMPLLLSHSLCWGYDDADSVLLPADQGVRGIPQDDKYISSLSRFEFAPTVRSPNLSNCHQLLLTAGYVRPVAAISYRSYQQPQLGKTSPIIAQLLGLRKEFSNVMPHSTDLLLGAAQCAFCTYRPVCVLQLLRHG